LKRKIKVLIVDDSAFMRKSLSIMIESDPNIEVVGVGKDGEDGFRLAKELKPDIITLDVEMPRMDGLTALKLIMKEAPTAVIMVSSITTDGADATIKAFEYGAIDFISKEQSFVSVSITKIKEELIRKIKSIVYQRWSRANSFRGSILNREKNESVAPKPSGVLPKMGYTAVALGISTGGPISLQKVIPFLSDRMNVPMFIVQHMPPKFTKSLADRLNGMSKVEVKEAEHGETVRKNVVYIAPGGRHIHFKSVGGNVQIVLRDDPEKTLHRPSVDNMIQSAAKIYGKKLLTVIMTGMGKDGLEGIKEVKALGGKCIAQDEHSCVVYGMPKAVVDNGLADVIEPLDKIANKINSVL
jgi:two-component system chemotaxis response regulator CheB